MGDMKINDKLLRGLKDGNETAFAKVFDQYHQLLYSLAYRYLKSMDDAQDAVQHAFMKLWEQHESFDFSSGVKSLLVAIMKNYILNEIRHKKIVFEKHYQMAQKIIEFDDGDFTDILSDNDLKRELYNVINRLPNQKREVCMLKIEQGCSNKEIADKMQISIPTVKSHYTQAIKLLRLGLGKVVVITQLIIIIFF